MSPLHRRPMALVLALLGTSAALSASACVLASHLIWNRTPSLPLGLYWLSTHESLSAVGDIVAFPVPADVRQLVHDRRYLLDGDVLLKPVVAVAGDAVCIREGVVTINDTILGRALPVDSQDRPLPTDTLCGPVPPGHLYVASHHPHSFDSRTFGPIDVRNVHGKATPLWTY